MTPAPSAPDHQPSPLSGLEELSAVAVKKSWLEVVEKAKRNPVVVARHDRPQVVVLSVEEFTRLTQAAAGAEEPLNALQRRFDDRLRGLNRPGAAERLKDAYKASPEEIGKMADGPLLTG